MTRARKGTGHLAKRPDKHGRWRGYLTDEGRRKWFYGRDAADVAEQMRLWQARGPAPVPSAETTEQFLRRWLDARAHTDSRARGRVISPATLQRYEELTRRYLIPILGAVPIATLAPRDLDRLYAKMRTLKKFDRARVRMKSSEIPLLSTSTIRRAHNVLYTALAWGVRRGELARNVAQMVDPPPEADRPRTTVDPAHIQAVLKAAKGDRFEALYLLAFATGLRLGELLALRWEHVDLEAGTLRVAKKVRRVARLGLVEGDPKSEASKRPIVIPMVAVRALREHRARQGAERPTYAPQHRATDRVFVNAAGGTQEAPAITERFWIPLLQRAGVPRMTFHQMTRGGSASLLINLGVDIETTRRRLGHASHAVTLEHYTRPVADADRQAAAQLDRMLEGLLAETPQAPGE